MTKRQTNPAAQGEIGSSMLVGWALTMLGVMFAWVFFRATTTAGAWQIVSAMLGMQGGEQVAFSQGQLSMIAIATLVAVLAPNSVRISGWAAQATKPGVAALALRVGLGIGSGAAFVAAAIAALQVSTSPFLYFNF